MGETAKNEVENNSLTVEQLEALRVEARSCERLNNCEAVQKKYRSLSLEQQDKIAALCSTDPIKCKAAYGGYVTDYMAFRSVVDRVMKDDIPYALKLDVATYVLQNLDARGMVADAVFAKQMAEKLGISEENARLISLAAWGVVGSTSKYKPNEGAIGNMKFYFSSSGFGAGLGSVVQKTSKQVDGQSVYKVTMSYEL